MLFADELQTLDTELDTTPASNNQTTINITVALTPEWKPTDTQGYTYEASWTLPDGTHHRISHRSPERDVCRAITLQGYGHAKVTFVDGTTWLPRFAFRRADIAGKYRLEERSRDGFHLSGPQIAPQQALE